MRIPLVNLAAQLAELDGAIRAAIDDVLKSAAFIQGPQVRAFEAEFTKVMGAAQGVACANGTAAISIALEALGVGRGDEVITVANTFIATAEAICHVGATPVFVDIDPVTHTMGPAAAAAAITPRTKALLPVQLFGGMADMDALAKLAAERGLLLVEDCAQAHLATWSGKAAGTLGDAGTFSFYPGKNLGSIGDAGFAFFRDQSAANRARKLVDHGRLSKYEHDLVGYNQRMDTIQAAVLLAKLPHLPEWTARRRQVAKIYDDQLGAHGFTSVGRYPAADPAYHLYVVEVSNRAETLDHLHRQGIGAGIHYPVPLHLQPAFAAMGGKPGMLPVTEAKAARILSLPICGSIKDDAVAEVVARFLEVAKP